MDRSARGAGELTPPLVIAHRGASTDEYENSLAAFRRAVRLGADGIELDVHDTADGAIVVHHDPSLNGRPIGQLTAADVAAQRLPNGEPVPTLDAALAAVGLECRVFVELKTLAPEHDAALLAVLSAGPAPSHYHVHGFDHRIVRRLTAQQAGLTAGVLSTSYPLDPWRQLADAGAQELWQEVPLIDRALVDGAHARGFRLYAWTVTDAAQARALLRLGVDGLCGNQPDVLRAALR